MSGISEVGFVKFHIAVRTQMTVPLPDRVSTGGSVGLE